MRPASTAALVTLSVCLLATQAGCAFGLAGLAMNGTRQNVFIDSNPSGAKVTLEGQVANTPAQFSLKRRRNYQAIIEKEGYMPLTAYINKETDAMVLYLDETASQHTRHASLEPPDRRFPRPAGLPAVPPGSLKASWALTDDLRLLYYGRRSKNSGKTQPCRVFQHPADMA
jgi:hypothetical protein